MSYPFTPDDQMQPVYCVDCHAHIPRAVAQQHNGRCPNCNVQRLAVHQAAVAQQQAQAAYIASLPQVAPEIVCPFCRRGAIYSIISTQQHHQIICQHCRRAFQSRYVRVRSKNARGDKKANARSFSIRVVAPDGSEDLIEFTNSGYQNFEIRANDWAILSYKNGVLATIQNLNINYVMFIQSPGCSGGAAFLFILFVFFISLLSCCHV